MVAVVIILLDALANLRGGYTDDGVRVCVVVGGTSENFNSQNSFLQLVGLAGEYARDYKSEEAGITLAGVKEGGGQQLFQLLKYGVFFRFAGRRPAVCYLLW